MYDFIINKYHCHSVPPQGSHKATRVSSVPLQFADRGDVTPRRCRGQGWRTHLTGRWSVFQDNEHARARVCGLFRVLITPVFNGLYLVASSVRPNYSGIIAHRPHHPLYVNLSSPISPNIDDSIRKCGKYYKAIGHSFPLLPSLSDPSP